MYETNTVAHCYFVIVYSILCVHSVQNKKIHTNLNDLTCEYYFLSMSKSFAPVIRCMYPHLKMQREILTMYPFT